MIRCTFSLRVFLLLVISIFVSFNSAYAAGTTTIIRGDPVTINWNVVGAPNCATAFGTLLYPNNSPSETVFNDWTALSPSNSGSYPFPKVWGNPAQAFPQSYSFVCTHGGTGATDYAGIIINDCNPGDTWNGTACVLAGPPVIGTSFIATPNPVAYNTSTVLSWAVTGTVTSCTLSGGQYGAGIAVLAIDNRTANNLTVATTLNP